MQHMAKHSQLVSIQVAEQARLSLVHRIFVLSRDQHLQAMVQMEQLTELHTQLIRSLAMERATGWLLRESQVARF
jgi:hypothetical protein